MPGSGHRCGCAVEVGADLAAQRGAVTGGDAVTVVDYGQSGVLHQVHAGCDGSTGSAEGEVGLTQTVQAAVFHHGSVTGEYGIGDIAKDDLHVAQAGSHATGGVSVAAGCDQCRLLSEQLAGCIGNDCGGVAGDAVDGIQTLVAVRDDGGESVNFAGPDDLSPGVGLGDNLGEGVEHLELLLAASKWVSQTPEGHRKEGPATNYFNNTTFCV
jgi:hypothetical protein